MVATVKHEKKCSPRNVPAVLSVGLAGARSSFNTSPGSPFLFMPTLEVSIVPGANIRALSRVIGATPSQVHKLCYGASLNLVGDLKACRGDLRKGSSSVMDRV